MIPYYHDRIYEGINTISCPTVLTIKNTDNKLYFNEDLNWLMDVEYYKRLFDKHGSPDIMPHIGVINRQAEVRATNLISEEQKQEEIKLLLNTFSNKINLPSVTLIAVTSVRLEEHIKALEYSSRGINFGAIKIISDIAPSVLPAGITHEYINKINNIDEWSYNIIYKLGDYIDTDYAMLIHDDGFIINPTSWREDFLKYDYIGAPWPIPNDNISYRDINGDLIRVGNSVSLRSKKLIDLPNKIKLEWKSFHGYYNEDGFICVNYRHKYIKHGCKFADINIAKYFSHENELPETKDIVPFAFHGKNKYKL
jgi:hypothetical protein